MVTAGGTDAPSDAVSRLLPCAPQDDNLLGDILGDSEGLDFVDESGRLKRLESIDAVVS